MSPVAVVGTLWPIGRVSFVFPSLHGYRKQWLSRDLVAGLTVWAVLVPEALAYATIAGVSPVVGLYAAPPALVFYALFGSSRHLVTGPMSATAALRRWLPLVPGSLVAVIAGVISVKLLSLDEHGVEIVGQAEGGESTVVAGRSYRSVRQAVEAVRPPDARTEGE